MTELRKGQIQGVMTRTMEQQSVENRYRDLIDRIRTVAEDCGRSFDEITLVAVTKGFGADAVNVAGSLGINAMGENRVHEALDKKDSLPSDVVDALQWHMVGHVQSNKVKHLLGEFELIHSVDRPSLIRELNKRLPREELTQRVLMQVNVSGEESKHGVEPGAAPELFGKLEESDVLTVSGLMTMAPFTDDEGVLRETFARCRNLRDDLEERFEVSLPDLSMGMTNDFEEAIREGSTMLRIGRGIFGDRPG